jgi:nicotinamidase-related amidase
MHHNTAKGLVVVVMDMHQHLVAQVQANERAQLVREHLRLVRGCLEHDIPLVVVETTGFGPTLEILNEQVAKVPRHRRINIATGDDGFRGTNLAPLLESFHARIVLLAGLFASEHILYTTRSGVDHGFGMMTSRALIADSAGRETEKTIRWYRAHAILLDKPPVMNGAKD